MQGVQVSTVHNTGFSPKIFSEIVCSQLCQSSGFGLTYLVFTCCGRLCTPQTNLKTLQPLCLKKFSSLCQKNLTRNFDDKKINVHYRTYAGLESAHAPMEVGEITVQG